MTKWTNREISELKDPASNLPWDDFRVPLNSVLIPGSNPPTRETFKTVFLVWGFSNTTDNFVYFDVQLPHSWKEGDAIEAHVHWTLPTAGAGAGAETVTWVLDYSWANIHDIFPDSSSATVTVDVQNEPASKHMLTELVHRLPADGKRISSILMCRLYRDVSEDNYAAKALVISVDFHYRSDSGGSWKEYFKLPEDYKKKFGKPKEPYVPGAQ